MSERKAYECNSLLDNQVSDLAQALGREPSLLIETGKLTPDV